MHPGTEPQARKDMVSQSSENGNPLPGNSLPGNSLPGNSLPGNSLPGNSLPDNSLPDNSLPDNSLPYDSPLSDDTPLHFSPPSPTPNALTIAQGIALRGYMPEHLVHREASLVQQYSFSARAGCESLAPLEHVGATAAQVDALFEGSVALTDAPAAEVAAEVDDIGAVRPVAFVHLVDDLDMVLVYDTSQDPFAPPDPANAPAWRFHRWGLTSARAAAIAKLRRDTDKRRSEPDSGDADADADADYWWDDDAPDTTTTAQEIQRVFAASRLTKSEFLALCNDIL